jgi:hypothetical protein
MPGIALMRTEDSMRAIIPAFASCLITAQASLLMLPAGNAVAESTVPLAREWASYCRGYMKALEGDATASDLDVTYCVGVTQGLLNGMQVGSQLGALNMGSQIALKYKLNPDEVFKMFSEQAPGRLLGVCLPAGLPTREQVRVVLEHIEKQPADLERPISEVLYEVLQAKYPCR